MVRDQIKKGRNKRHHVNASEDEEPIQKKERNNDSDDEYSLISALTGVGHKTHTERGGELVCGHFYQISSLFQTIVYN